MNDEKKWLKWDDPSGFTEEKLSLELECNYEPETEIDPRCRKCGKLPGRRSWGAIEHVC